MKKYAGFMCVMMLLWGVTGIGNATILTFDDIGGEENLMISDGYGGLDWDGMWYMNTISYSYKGYVKGRVSGDYVAFNGYAKVATVSGLNDDLFDFIGVYLTGAWNNDLNINLKGYRDGAVFYERTVAVDTTSAIWFDFSFLGIDRLEFDSYGGTDAGSDDRGSGTHFVMDNFIFNKAVPVPEPSTMILLGFGIAVLSLFRKRKPDA